MSKEFLNKDQRQACWNARDTYWSCIDDKAPKYQATSGAAEPKECLQLRKLFETSCPSQWVKHFDRKRTYEQFKKKMDRGYDPVEHEKNA